MTYTTHYRASIGTRYRRTAAEHRPPRVNPSCCVVDSRTVAD